MSEISPHSDYATIINHVRERLELLIDSNDKRYDQRNQYQQDALKLVLNELTDQGKRMITRSEIDLALKILTERSDAKYATSGRIDIETKCLQDKLNDIGKPNWAMMGSTIFVLIALIAGMYTIIITKIDSSLSSLESQGRNLSRAVNDMQDQNQRINGLLWKRVYNEPLPPTNYRQTFFKDNAN